MQNTNPLTTRQDCIDFINVVKAERRAKDQAEFKKIMQLRMAVLLSVFKSTSDELMDDPRIESRVNALLDHVRTYGPTLNFHAKFTRQANELAPGIWLKVNFACTEAALYRDKGDTVTYMEIPA